MTDQVPMILGKTVGGIVAVEALDLPLLAVVPVTLVSVLFGLFAHRDEKSPKMTFTKAGAVWVLALALSVNFAPNIVMMALIALSTGLAGERALAVLEAGAMRLTKEALRILGGKDKED